MLRRRGDARQATDAFRSAVFSGYPSKAAAETAFRLARDADLTSGITLAWFTTPTAALDAFPDYPWWEVEHRTALPV